MRYQKYNWRDTEFKKIYDEFCALGWKENRSIQLAYDYIFRGKKRRFEATTSDLPFWDYLDHPQAFISITWSNERILVGHDYGLQWHYACGYKKV